ncbi:MAG: hypothetical protein HYT16_01730 [DPANN group archaeon]|nr:hypothetical protein [DPANN group archaeon]
MNRNLERTVCYAALALVTRNNAPTQSRVLANTVAELFDIAFNSSHYVYAGTARDRDALFRKSPAALDSRLNLYSLEPNFYASLLAVIKEQTGKLPVDGVRWLAERYRRSLYFQPTPMGVFNAAKLRFKRKKH